MLQNQLLFLVDDDIDDHEIFKSALAKVDEDLELITATNGYEALNMLSTANTFPDYIFVDLNMPGMGGLQFLKEIKQTDNLKHLPVIIYTTSSNPVDIANAKELGAVTFITKPARFAELCNLLRSLIGGQSTTSRQTL
ncbi:MAG: response regulator [Niastella sp.]|uniref:response regulator n=1 Tax=Niastella sp. TaxID=1869183 RepID=UPI00389A5BD3